MGDERQIADALDRFIAETPGADSKKIAQELSKIKGKLGITNALNPVYSEGMIGKSGIYMVPMVPESEKAYIETIKKYLSEDEIYARGKTGKLTRRLLSREQILANVRSGVAGELAVEDIARHTVKTSEKNLIAGYLERLSTGKKAITGFGGVAGPATVTQAIKDFDMFLAKNPDLMVPSLKGGVAGYLDLDSLQNRVDKFERIARQAKVPFKEGEVRSLITSRTDVGKLQKKILEKRSMTELRRGSAGALLGGKEVSQRLREINETFKTQGANSVALKKFGGIRTAAIDLETTGFKVFGAGAEKDYITQVGISGGTGKAQSFYVNQFPRGAGGKGFIPEALKTRYLGPTGAYGVTGIGLETALEKGLSGKAFTSRLQKTVEENLLLTWGGEVFDMPRIRGVLPRKYMGARSLDVIEMAKKLMPRNTIKFYGTKVGGQRAFNKLYAQGNIALNLGLIKEADVVKLHGATMDADLTRRIYERLLPSAEKRISIGLGAGLEEFMPDRALVLQKEALRAGEILSKDISNLGIKTGSFGSAEMVYSISKYKLEEMPGGMGLIGRLEEGVSNKVAQGRPAAQIMRPKLERGRYLLQRNILDPQMSIDRAFGAEYGEKLTQIRDATTISNRNIQRQMPEWMSAAKKNWKGIAMAGAALGVGLYILHNWKSKPYDPVGNQPGEQADSSLFGGTGMNTMQPPTMEGEGIYDQAERARPMSYAARIMDPNSVATNIRVRGGIENRIDYNALGRAMGIMGSSITGAESSNVSMRVSDNTTKMSDGDIRRRIARMA